MSRGSSLHLLFLPVLALAVAIKICGFSVCAFQNEALKLSGLKPDSSVLAQAFFIS